MKRPEKRTNTAGTDAPGLAVVQDPPLVGEADRQQPGVGARQGQGRPPGRGGGYQGNCTASNFRPDGSDGPKKIDPRTADFQAMGLSPMWLRVIATIGVDHFLALWRVLDEHPPHWHDSGRLRIEIRRYSAYLRFQRNRYVEALHLANVPLPEIRRLVDLAFGEKLTEVHLSRIGARHKLKRGTP